MSIFQETKERLERQRREREEARAREKAERMSSYEQARQEWRSGIETAEKDAGERGAEPSVDPDIEAEIEARLKGETLDVTPEPPAVLERKSKPAPEPEPEPEPKPEEAASFKSLEAMLDEADPKPAPRRDKVTYGGTQKGGDKARFPRVRTKVTPWRDAQRTHEDAPRAKRHKKRPWAEARASYQQSRQVGGRTRNYGQNQYGRGKGRKDTWMPHGGSDKGSIRRNRIKMAFIIVAILLLLKFLSGL